MNNQRRKRIDQISAELSVLALKAKEILDEEEESYDNMGDNLQFSVRGIASAEAIDYLTDGISCINDAINAFEDAAV